MNEITTITIEVAARELGLSIWSVRRLCKLGTLKAHKVGRAWRVDRRSVVDVLNGKFGDVRVTR